MKCVELNLGVGEKERKVLVKRRGEILPSFIAEDHIGFAGW